MEGITLENMFAMDFAKFHNIVQTIVSNAVKESKIEDTLNQIIEYWKVTEFTVVKHYRGPQDRGFILGPVDELLKVVENDMMNLQSMVASPYVGPFVDQVKHWEKTVQTISEVLEVWIEVQKKWIYLGGIFGGDDIKVALPDLAQKFNEADKTFRQIMLDTSKRLNIHDCCKVSGRRDNLKRLIEILDLCRKSLTYYLDNKRIIFPRFYFLSDDELLGILGTNDVESIQNYIGKMFDNLERIQFQKEEEVNDDVEIFAVSLVSAEGEIMTFKNRVSIRNRVEEWMLDVLQEMRRSHRYLIKKAIYDYGKAQKSRCDWMLDCQGTIVLAADQAWWTAEVEYVFEKIKDGQKSAMKEYIQLLNNQLSEVLILIKNNSHTNNDRKKLEMILTIDVHLRDIIDGFIRDGTEDSEDFKWACQLRFYWIKQSDGLWVHQCTGNFEYSYEYIGLNDRLVVTPLTDRLYLTVTQALSMCLGVAVSGPAATGKTETIKDLAKILGRLCIVTNCTKTMDHTVMIKILSGLTQCGAWGCLDEFNHVTESDLSVISTQLYIIRSALRNMSKTFVLEGQSVALDPNTAVFVTINPTSLIGTRIPESIKSSFRPAVCIIPDTDLICQVMLYSMGFETAKILAHTLTSIYKFASQLFCKQWHYDFSLRSVKSVLHAARRLKNIADLPEEVVLIQALKEINMPKLIADDVSIFNGLLKDFFPSVDCPDIEYTDFSQLVEDTIKNERLIVVPHQVKKIVQLYQLMKTRNSIMIIGPTSGGKTTIIKTLCKILSLSNQPAKIHILNPKACTVIELYGIYDSKYQKWTDGLLSKIFREINQPPDSSLNEIINFVHFDGDVDIIWAENMNSVMDDNKILTLANQERIKLQSYCYLIFEAGSLAFASPATVSRAGMIYVDPRNLGYQPYLDKWINTRPTVEQEIFREVCDKFIPGAIGLIIEGVLGLQQVVPLKMIIDQTPLNMVTQFCQMIDCLYSSYSNNHTSTQDTDESNVDKAEIAEDEHENMKDLIQAVVIQACYSSFGAVLAVESRLAFDEYMKRTSGLMLIEDTDEKFANIRYLPITYRSLYDYVLDVEEKIWKPWKSLIPIYVHDENKEFCNILVPTTDTLQIHWFIKLMNSLNNPTLLIGEPGSSKTAIVYNYLNSLDNEKFSQLLMNFSSRTTSIDVQKNLESILEKITKDLYGPLPGKRLMIFIDDISLPSFDCFGTQQPIAFLKLLLEYKGFYDRCKDLNWKQIRDVCYLTTMGRPAGGKNTVDPRFISLFSVYNVVTPNDSNLSYIYTNILSGHLDIFPQEVQDITTILVDMTLELYTIVKASLLPTPSKLHYTFNLRDISKIFAGLLQSTPNYFGTVQQFLRLWRNEVTRVICDRLIDDDDQAVVNDYIENKIKEVWNEDREAIKYSLRNPLLFGDFRNAVNDSKLRYYEDVLDYEAVYNLFMEILEQYNEKDLKLNLVLFNDVLDHLTRIHRALRLHRGHVSVIGVNGCGKQSIIKLASYAANYEIFEISLHRGYNENHFRRDMKKLYNLVGVENRHVTFLFKSTQITDESFLEIINSILVTGVVPSLFDDEEIKSIISQCRTYIGEEGQNITKENIFIYFEKKNMENLRIALSMNPTDNNLRDYWRNYPGILNCTSIDWISPWSQEAFQAVANVVLINNINVSDEQHKNIIQYVVDVHISVDEYSSKFFTQTRRNNYITPIHFVDFINTYTQLLNKKRAYINLQCERLTKGLQKISDASQSLVKLRDALTSQRKQVIEQTEQCEKLLISIDENTRIAKEKQRLNKGRTEELEERKKIIEKESAVAKTALDNVQPELDAARMALNELEKSDIIELRSFVTPPEPVQVLGECIVILRGLKDISWKTAKGLMSDPGFLKTLQDIRVEEVTVKQQQMIRTHLKKSDKFDQIESISNAGFRLYKFVLSMLEYCTIYREIKPKIVRVRELEAEATHATAILQKEETEFVKIEKQLADLNAKYDVTIYNKEKLERETNLLEGRLIAAEKLINSLTSENIRWRKDVDNLHDELELIIGNCLLSASFLEYCGPFSYEFRNSMIYDWQSSLLKKNIPLSQPYRLEDQLTNDVEICHWNADGLPCDEFSIQNGILTTHASRFPLCVDPQQLALRWIKKHEDKNNLKIVSFYDEDFVKQLEMAIQYGFSIIIEDVDFIDPVIDNVLRKNIHHVEDRSFVTLKNRDINYNKNFRLYLSTKLSNPSLHPAVYSKTTVVNHVITTSGLNSLLLTILIQIERPDIEKERDMLTVSINENKELLQKVERSLLKEISMNQGNMLDNIDLIEMLDKLKSCAIEAEKEINKAETTISDINKHRDMFLPVARRGVLLFFVLTDMVTVNHMYQYSLRNYIEVFSLSIIRSLSSPSLEKRQENIIEILTKNVYDYGCLGTFQQDKLLFSFTICTTTEIHDNNISLEELNFFVNGNDNDNSTQSPLDWLSDTNWSDLVKLSRNFIDFSDVCNQVQNNTVLWQEWNDADYPESQEFPCGYSEKRPFQRLMLLRCFRIDRLYCAIANYISELMGMEFIIPRNIGFDILLEKSKPTVPIIFILSNGADPTAQIMKFAGHYGFDAGRFKYLCLGQGQEQNARGLIEIAATRGQWIILENIHLLTEFTRELEYILENISSPHPEFRLWLTTLPTDNLPVGILQQSIKIITEPPDGLKFKLHDTYLKMDNETLECCNNTKYKHLIYVTAFFHAVIRERKKYHKIGWNINYDFNEADFSVTTSILNTYLTKPLSTNDALIPWSGLKYLILNVIYGERIIDSYDYRIIKTYVDEYFGDFLFDDIQPFYFYKNTTFNYVIPPTGSCLDYVQFIETLPLANNPEVLGLHSNAKINYFTSAIETIWRNLNRIKPHTNLLGKNSINQNCDEKINNLIDDILIKIPDEYNIVKIKKLFGLDISPLTIFLLQELEKFNKLIQIINTTLNELKNALTGNARIDSTLERISNNLYYGILPKEWASLAPATEKNLAEWINHFCKRTAQYSEWSSGNEPVVIWLSGFHAPKTYLTALIQIICRKNSWSLDKTHIHTEVSMFKTPEEIEERLDQGWYVNGLFIEGARWDMYENCLKQLYPKVPVEELPILIIVPIQLHRLGLHNTVKLPVYVTPNRQDITQKGLVFEANLRTRKHVSLWILQGVCLLLNLK